MRAFQIKVDGKTLDYRLGEKLDLDEVKAFFKKKYQVVKLWSAGRHVVDYLSAIIDFAEEIATLPAVARNDDDTGMTSHKQHFLEKTKLWFEDIPLIIREKYQIIDLLNLVKSSYQKLEKRPRHGDFTPWHLMLLRNGKLGLIDGEHALENGVENYDLGYFIQRVYSVLKNPVLAKKILELLIKRGYKMEKLKTILASRAIGGVLDEALKPKPNYQMAASFKEFVKSL